jgi:hypothetical protein
MSKIFEIPVNARSFSLALPNRCVNCGRPREAQADFKFTRPARADQRLPQEIALAVPQCARCRARSERTDYLMWLSFFLGALAAAAVAWVAYNWLWNSVTGWLVGSSGLMPSTEESAATVILMAALISGIPGGFLLEALARPLFLPFFPFFGVSILHAPLLAVQLLGGVEYTAGLRGNMSRGFQALRLKFYNDDVAREFAQMIGQAG